MLDMTTIMQHKAMSSHLQRHVALPDTCVCLGSRSLRGCIGAACGTFAVVLYKRPLCLQPAKRQTITTLLVT